VEPQTLPGPFPIDLNLERPTQERTNEHNQSKYAYAGEGRIDSHAIDDVGGNQEFQPEHNGSAKIETQTMIGGRAITKTDKRNYVPGEREDGTNHQNGNPCQFECCGTPPLDGG
jgi:YD repeat-containing protein